MENKEIWKDIVGYEGLYKVSNLGNVLSCERYKKNTTKSQTKIEEHLLKQTIVKHKNHKERAFVQLWKNNHNKCARVHRLVAKAFIPNPENKPTVNHIDGNPLNNNVDNLEWATYSENEKHAYAHGLINRRKQIENISKLTKEDMDFIVSFYRPNDREHSFDVCAKMLNNKVTKKCLSQFMLKQTQHDYWRNREKCAI